MRRKREDAMPVAESPAGPGWYEDPDGLPTLRWWDGMQWTDRLAPMRRDYVPEHQIMVTRSRRRTSHGLHLFLTIVTCGLWAPVWILMTIGNKINKDESVSRIYR